MTQVTAALVKELREKTGAGMMDCKKALHETDADLEQAVDWLRTKGLAAAAKKAGRVAAEGLIGLAASEQVATMVEVNSETDFVARNEQFQGFVRDIAAVALEQEANDVEALKAAPWPGGSTVGEQLTQMIATIGENMDIRRVQTLKSPDGVLASYIHNQEAPGLGGIGVLVALRSSGDVAVLTALGKQLAMHIAAIRPLCVSREDVQADMLEHERKVLSDRARETGKPEAIIEKMVEGQIRKFYEEICLLEQPFAIDGETKISAVLEAAAKDAGAAVSVSTFALYKLGEGIEKQDDDFAAEVAAVAKG